jgi:Carboxypeptidase regulatory-like domain
MLKLRCLVPLFGFVGALLLTLSGAFAQETTGGIVGTVKDPSGGVMPGVKVEVTGDMLVGSKEATTDHAGYYRFVNLPPGNMTITATAPGFATFKRDLVVEVGHLPTVDITLQVGRTETVVEVSGSTPVIDPTTNVTTTNLTESILNSVPHGLSFQSIIQFAPAARNEPLMGTNTTIAASSFGAASSNGTGGGQAGSMSNGGGQGFSVGGGSDSENSYLVEGQETANLIGGFSHTNVPFDFVQEVEIKNSGIQAEHGGALGGVVNVVMRKGTNAYHGSVFSQFESDGTDANQIPPIARYNPLSSQTTTSWGLTDPQFQEYVPKKDHFTTILPGFTVGGPIRKDRVFFFAGFNPWIQNVERSVNYDQPGGLGLGVVKFGQNTRTYYTNARVDAAVTQKLRVYASWLYQLQKQYGESLPFPDSSQGYFNASSTIAPSTYSHTLGYTAPNSTTNAGVDYSITPRLILTGRFGYYFENYHDFGYPTTGTLTAWNTNGVGATDVFGNPLPASLQQPNGFVNVANSINFTARNANKAIQVEPNMAWTKSGWIGTHNFKFGYQLNRLSNDVFQHFNVPAVEYFVGKGAIYSPQGPVGTANCAPLIATYGQCSGQYGYIYVYDIGSLGKATSYNHGFFVQDSWSIARGFTINAGVRLEREYLPAEEQPAGNIGHPIDFGWGKKVAPRIGVAWDPTGRGKMKIFGGYGQFYDQMKLNLAISSFGGQFWQNCYYALNTANVASIAPVINSAGRYCGGAGTNSATEANFGGTTPAGITFLENQNFRAFPTTCSTCSATEEGVAPGLNPYKQHEITVGFDYQLFSSVAFEARYDRRRLDHVIEDSSLFNPSVGETFVIVNPGQGVNSTYNGFYNFLYGLSPGQPGASPCGSCPPTIPAQRDYDGVELRLTKTSKTWNGMFSYTWSRLWGNYSGLTSSMQEDGGGGRNAPNNSRAFDEPMFSWDSFGRSSSGLLPTDRPNALKGFLYYQIPWLRKMTTDLGIFQVLYQGAPETSVMDVGFAALPFLLSGGGWSTNIVDRGKWVDVSQDPTTGAISFGPPHVQRTPWYTQTDFNFQQTYKVAESKAILFSATFTNLLNQKTMTALVQTIDSGFAGGNYIAPNGLPLLAGTPFYQATFQPYDYAALANAAFSNTTCAAGHNCGPLTVTSGYGSPDRYQLGRTIRLQVKFTF